MKTIPLRNLLREPVKVKRLTRSGQSVQVTDNGNSGDTMDFSMDPSQLNFNTCIPGSFEGPMTQANVKVQDG